MTDRWARWAAAAVLLAAFVTVLSGRGTGGARNQLCNGVSINTDTYGATPREALVSYVESRGGDTDYWEMEGASTFRITDERARPQGLERIGALEHEPGVWRVTGGCAGNFATPAKPRPTQPRIALSRSSCDGSAFLLKAAQGRSHAPFTTWEFTLTNVSDQLCVVEGFPNVIIRQNDYELSLNLVRRGGVMTAEPPRRPVRLKPGSVAHFVLEKDACTPDDLTFANSARVFLHGAGQLTAAVPNAFRFCGNGSDIDVMAQTPFVANLADAYRLSPVTHRCRSKDLRPESAGEIVTDGLRTWTVRFVNVGVALCELRGTPAIYFHGPEVGLKPEFRHSQSPVMLVPGAAAQLRFEKQDCVRPETPIPSARLRPPATQGLVDVPLPAGLQKCDFKDPGNNVIRFGPFEPSR
ncbi:MAG: DUF4232 domain-containing protein [Acidimicrobiales bacterium]|nr:DUF4232 domain-containing protein [Acidimicrobiales bacterium]